MGTSYEAICIYGLVYQCGDDDVEGSFESGDWPDITKEAVGHDPDGDCFDFDSWYDTLLGVPDLPEEWSKLPTDERMKVWQENRDLKRQLTLERFGVEFETTYMGHIEYGSANVVYPSGARKNADCFEPVETPDWPLEQLELWRAACLKLAELLPGARGPGLFFGPRVG